jgi:hypothetical protein
MRRLALRSRHRHHEAGDDPEATQLILQLLFHIKAEVHDIHVAIFGGGDDDVEGSEEEDS